MGLISTQKKKNKRKEEEHSRFDPSVGQVEVFQNGIALHDLEDLTAGLRCQFHVADVERREPGVMLQSTNDGHCISAGKKQPHWLYRYFNQHGETFF